VTVATTGTYTFTFRVRNNLAGTGVTGAFHMALADSTDVDLTGLLNVPAATDAGTDYNDVVKTGVSLTAGSHVLKIVIDNGVAGANGWWFNYFKAQ
jgi:hypothetical protein